MTASVKLAARRSRKPAETVKPKSAGKPAAADPIILRPSKPAIVTVSSLASRAMLVSLRIRLPAMTKTDKKVTAEVHADHQIDESVNAGQFRKQLLEKDAMKALSRIAGFARNEHYDLTLPWSQDGIRILSSRGYAHYMERMQDHRKQFEEAKPIFVELFPQFIAQRAVSLGSMFNPADYPEASKIADMIGFDLKVFPLPTASDFRADLDPAQVKAIQDDIEAQTNAAIDSTVSFIFDKLAKLIGHMSESLKEYTPSEKLADGRETKPKNVFRNSLVENIREIVNLMPSLNITGNSKLDEITARIQADLCPHDAEDLRESDGIRQKTAAKADAILADISGFLA